MTTNSSVHAEWTGNETSLAAAGPLVSTWLVWAGLVLLLVGELIVLTLPFDPSGNIAEKGFWAGALFVSERGIRPTFITAVVATVFLSWPVLTDEFHRVVGESPSQLISLRWLAVHLVLLGLLIFGTREISIRLTSMEVWEGWLLVWSIVAGAALVSWLFSVLPPRFWIRWVRRSRTAFLGAALAGACAYALGNWTKELWWPLQRSTFEIVAFILRAFGQEAVNRPEALIIGTSHFSVTIGSECSGLEGIGLMCAFTGIYLWMCRRDLSFPQALLLIPIGAGAIWLFNSVRIATLIFIGGWNPDAAIKGFHSAAGWIFFNLVALGLVWSSSRTDVFAKTARSKTFANPAVGFLLPVVVLAASSLVATMLWLGPVFSLSMVAIAVLCAIWYCWPTLASLSWQPSWISVLAGGAVFAIISVTSDNPALDASFAAALHKIGVLPAALAMTMTMAGSIVAVPIAQELAFRGYLLRKLISADFETVSFTQFTWLSFVVSSATFGLFAQNWIAGVLAGMIFALVAYRRGRLSDAIVAHACSGGLLFLLAAIAGKWSLLG